MAKGTIIAITTVAADIPREDMAAGAREVSTFSARAMRRPTPSSRRATRAPLSSAAEELIANADLPIDQVNLEFVVVESTEQTEIR